MSWYEAGEAISCTRPAHAGRSTRGAQRGALNAGRYIQCEFTACERESLLQSILRSSAERTDDLLLVLIHLLVHVDVLLRFRPDPDADRQGKHDLQSRQARTPWGAYPKRIFIHMFSAVNLPILLECHEML